MDVDVFRELFLAFRDEYKFSDEMIELWGEQADHYLKESWILNGPVFEHAKSLMTAHLVHLASSVASGNGANGAVQSATEGSVSVSFSAPPSRNGWEYWLSSSPYGVQLWALLNSLGSAGLYIGGLPERKAVRKVGGVFL
ncbi:DUF4054 domain-containing protein [Rodentibacter caecimuris]|uniref:DUF4054 domain-containing protein n=1 Tax=Rodentibacter caecimuris TaxID=1796644 RepID=UPI0013A085F8|nr:DUF4054 domain-containing protein [Rodentibacter heylii]QIA76172.1 DUF4054 domain-containing protein [Rodentibacter heylii]